MSGFPVFKLAAALLALAGLAAIAFVAQRPPDGPVTPVFDKQACAHCRMHIGDPRFCAQVQTEAGDVRFYDDPGCLLEHLLAEPPRVHAIWFHHLREERWLAGEDAAFVEVEPTPMGFGYGAVAKGTPGSIEFTVLRARWPEQRSMRR